MALCEPPEHIDGVGPDPGIAAVAVGLSAGAYPSCAPPSQAGPGNFVHERLGRHCNRLTRTASRISGLDPLLRTTQILGLGRNWRTAEINTLGAMLDVSGRSRSDAEKGGDRNALEEH